jgi:hypothetical protein
MGRKRKAKGYSILWAEAVCCVSEDRVYDPDSEPEKSFMDELSCPTADGVLIALRKAFSLTFPRNPFIDGVQSAMSEIRRIGVEAMKPMPDVLSELNLAPLPLVMNDPVMKKAHLFKFVLARTSDIDISVRVGNKKQRLLDVVEHQDATPLLTTLRSVITDTFTEAHDEDQHMAILHQIRERIQNVLPDFNACLEAIEIEPIAEQPSETSTETETEDDNSSAG